MSNQIDFRKFRTGKYPPYGWDISPKNRKRLVANPHQQDGIKLMLELRNDGLSLMEIGLDLLRAGYKPQRAKVWEPTTIKKILEREAE